MSGTPIIRSDDLRTENRYRLLETLRRNGPLSRAALGERTRLSAAAMSTLIVPMVAEGVLETTSSRGGRGRPQTTVALSPGAASVVTVALTIDRLRTAVVDYGGTALVTDEHVLDTRSLDAAALLEVIGHAVSELAPHAPDGRFEQIGVGFQGATDNISGALLWSPIIGARTVPLRAALETRFGAPANVNNDCALIARALHLQHRQTLGPNFATVLFAHGVGLGLTLEGRSVAGIRSSALEIGHLRFERDGAPCRCGRRGCIEAYAADYGIERMARGDSLHGAPLGRVDPDTLDRLISAARDGEPAAVQAFAIAGAAVGEGLATLFTLFDPMPVALVGRSDEAFALMANGLRGALREAGFGAAGPVATGHGSAKVDRDSSHPGRDAPEGSASGGAGERDDGDGHLPTLHGFDEDESLLDSGLALDALDTLDRRIAAGSVPVGGGAGPTGPRGAGAGRRGAGRRKVGNPNAARAGGARVNGRLATGGLAALLALGTNVCADAEPPRPETSTPWSERALPVHVELDGTGRPLEAAALSALVASGERLFSARFTRGDGVGRPLATQAILPTKRRRAARTEFSRTAGLDANACASCHHAPTTGGAGDFSANVFVSEGFSQSDFDTTDPQFSNERNTNHLFGAGLIELLAREMSAELQGLRRAALSEAGDGGEAVDIDLFAKGVPFGSLRAHPDGRVDTRDVVGVDIDLVVRPFGHKGVMTSLRQFTVNALNHHHGMQPRERFGARWTGETDHDGDGHEDEITEGDVSALVAWQATLPPPATDDSLGADWLAAAGRGRDRFDALGCTDCHRESLPLDSLVFADPGRFDAAGTLRPGEGTDLLYDLGTDPRVMALPRDADGRVLVPLFGDLKRHVIADARVATLGNELLSQRFVERDVFMTTELWGVGSTAPYGHRGDLTTLAEVIRAHGGEAHASRDAWLALSEAGRGEVIAFLRSLVIVP